MKLFKKKGGKMEISRDSTKEEINMINKKEKEVMEMIDAISNYGNADKRWLSTAKTHLEIGFMVLRRSVTKPNLF